VIKFTMDMHCGKGQIL